ncbi:MAG: competence/damage-inducible protein A [Dethiobacteria bacterium]|nr:competence/damage-inducible protein A [Dethiobacteria bacterium]
MLADLICVGNELLTGLIENSNSGFLARRLWSTGIPVRESIVVADDLDSIKTALNRALEKSDMVIVTGGLGPTDDDLTRESVASILGLSLLVSEQWKNKLSQFFLARGIAMPQNNLKQAHIIEGSMLLENKRGTAPGLLINHHDKIIVLLPGPPHEMQLIFDELVLPYIVMRNGSKLTKVKTLKCFGLGESALEEKIKEFGGPDMPALSYIARGYEVNLQIKGSGDRDTADAYIKQVEQKIRVVLGDYIYGIDDDTLADSVADLFVRHNLTLALAESCSGGLLSDLLTDIPGSSRYYKGGLVAYSRSAKQNLLGVGKEILERNGEVSEITARAMAEQARLLFLADFGIGVTGIAGPDSDASQSPVGLVYIAVASPGGCECDKLTIGGGRRVIKERAAQYALAMLRKALLEAAREMQ